MPLIKKLFRFPLVLWWLPPALVLVFFAPVLFQGKLFFNSVFIRHYDLPIHVWFGQAWRAGAWSINPFYYGGFPSYLSQIDLLHPIVLVVYAFLPALAAYHWTIAASFLGQWYAMYWLCRVIGLSRRASFLSAVAWIFNQWNVQWGTLEGLGVFLATVPLLFVSLIKIHQKRYRYVFLAAAVMAPAWVFSLTQTTLYLGLAGGGLALYLDMLDWRFAIRRYRTTGTYLVVLAISVLIVLPLIRADYIFSQLSWRSSGLSYSEAVNDYYGIPDLLHAFSPLLLFKHVTSDFPHFYAGAIPLVLFVLSWGIRNPPRFVSFFRWLWAGAFFAAFRYSPLFYCISRLPVFNLFRGPGKFLFLANLAFAVLIGFAWDHAPELLELHGARVHRWLKKLLSASVVLIVAVNAVFLAWFDVLVRWGFRLFMAFGYRYTFHREPAHYVGQVRALLADWFSVVSLDRPGIWLFFLVWAGALIVFGLWYRRAVGVGTTYRLMLGLMAAGSLAVWHAYFQFVPRSVLDPAPTTAFLQSHAGEAYRVFHFDVGPEDYRDLGVALDDPGAAYRFELVTLRPDGNILYGLSTIDGYDNLATRRQQFVRDFANQFVTRTMTLSEKRELFEKKETRRMLSMMNVRYVLSPLELDAPLIRRAEAVIPETAIPLFVYENPEALPRTYFASQPSFVPAGQSDEALRKELWSIADVRARAMIECNGCVSSGGSAGTADITAYRPGHLEIKTKNASAGWLIVGESFLPGWVVSIDGKAVQHYPANYLFLGIEVPAGSHTVILSYDILNAAQLHP